MRKYLPFVAAALLLAPGIVQSAKLKSYKPSRSDTHRQQYDVHFGVPADAKNTNSISFDRPALSESPTLQGRQISSATAPPPPSPGLVIGQSSYDYQHNLSQGYQVARTAGADVVHFTWMAWNRIPTSIDDNDRYLGYNSYTISTNTINQGFGGVFCGLGELARAGYANIAVGDGNDAAVACHQREDAALPYNPWHLHYGTPGVALHLDQGLGGYGWAGCSDVQWPRIAVQHKQAAPDIHHLIAHDANCQSQNVWYWRYDGSQWQGPALVDSNYRLGYVLAADKGSSRVAIVMHTDIEPQFGGMLNVCYYESNSNGLGWLDGSELGSGRKNIITNYSDPNGPQAWGHISTAYDNSGTLQVVWDEQREANRTSDVAIRHWNSSLQSINTVALAYWPGEFITGAYSLKLSKVTLGVGDGGTVCEGQPNNNFLYVLYTRFGGPTQQEEADHSALGYYNGELYLNVSADRGLSWSPPRNLTNTKTPYCHPGPADTVSGLPQRPDSVCRSEHWATIGMAVSDIDVFFISDLDAGGVAQGEGSWFLNPVHYMRIPGGSANAPVVCPTSGPYISAILDSDPECEFHTPPGTIKNDVVLTIENVGNAGLNGAVSVLPGSPWLSVTGGGAFVLGAAEPALSLPVAMDASALSAGGYSGTIRITHSDTLQPSPIDIPVYFVVANNWYCPEAEQLRTAEAQGILTLSLETTGRFGSQVRDAGLWRSRDGSSSVYDGSLVIAHGTQGTDTVVFRDFYEGGNDPGQNGFQPLSSWTIDSTASGTGQGFVSAECDLMTIDGTVGVHLEWAFPQHPDSADFVIARYTLSNRTAAAIEDLVVGQWIDFDVYPADYLKSRQIINDNLSGADSTLNLIYQTGHDAPDWNPSDTMLSTERYHGGITYIHGPDNTTPASMPIRAMTRENVDYGDTGPSSGFMYRMLVGPTGYDIFVPPPPPIHPPDPDLYVVMTLDQWRILTVGQTLDYVVALVSDTLGGSSFRNAVQKSWEWARNNGFGCNCDCHADPMCDGFHDVLDVVLAIDVAFRGHVPFRDASCPRHGSDIAGRSDVDCSGTTDIADVVRMIDVVFRGANRESTICALSCAP